MKKIRAILALLLIITIVMQSFRLSGIRKVEGKDSDMLKAGDWLYLKTTLSNGNWQDAGAKVYMYYQTKDGNPWKNIELEKYDNSLLRVRIPKDMAENGEFLFRRYNPDNVNLDSWNSSGGMWNRCPAENAGNIKLAECPTNCNTYMLTGWNSGSWAGAGVWNSNDYGGQTVYFLNMDLENAIGNIQAVFTENGTNDSIQTMEQRNDEISGLYAVVIPDDKEYDNVVFKDDLGNELGNIKILDGDYEPDTANTYYYKQTSKENGEYVNRIDVYPSGTERISGKKLYLDSDDFPVNSKEEVYIQIGTEEETKVTADSLNADIFSYTIPQDSSADGQTVLTIIRGGNRYHFFWNDINKNMVYCIADIAGVYDTYWELGGDKRVVYFDATLSKLSYAGDTTESFAIPEEGKKVWYRAWKDGAAGNETYGEMTLLSPRERRGNTYKDVWKAELDLRYDRILFFSGNSQNDYRKNTTATDELTIPSSYARPCFYADSGDYYVYSKAVRNGYWAEVYTVRDSEKYKGDKIVDIPNDGTFVYQKLAYYVPITLYDYYTDYELNGSNRDSYPFERNYSMNEHRIYQPFRQFNMALSDYYKNVGAKSQLYWGNFQHPTYGEGSRIFNEIAGNFNLFGYSSNQSTDTFKKFFYQNNSMWGRDSSQILADGNNATVGLVSESLTAGNNLAIHSDKGNVETPFFNKEFLEGKNSKNTVLGKVYEDVKFPFVQKHVSAVEEMDIDKLYDLDGNLAKGMVDYWCFDSGNSTMYNSNLRLKQDKVNGEYYMETGDGVKGTTTSGQTDKMNYFPFNDIGQSGNAGRLNYGFGQKMEFQFRLTNDGSVSTTEKDEKVPIEFTFSGDDDVWIFIDGLLVLDVGGGHGVVDGRINFHKRESRVSGVKNETGNGISKNVTQTFPAELLNDSEFYNKEHTLTMFYMERGLWESNLHIKFNFPDESVFSVEKEVETDSVNNIFKNIYDNAEFSFNMKNQATHYGAVPVGTSTGFVANQADIPGYGSVDSGRLENVAGALYKLNDSDKNVDANGIFKLKNGERADFMNQFRRGSYIYLNEEVSQDYFNTRWELYDNDSKVTSSIVPNGHVNTMGGKVFDDNNTKGTVISDGRQESYVSDVGIANQGYTETGPAKIGAERRDTNDTIVFRSYNSPDSSVGLNIRVKEINTVRTGSVIITKTQEEGSSDLGETEFEFKVVFTNVSNMQFEGDTPVEHVVKIKKGESYTISGIPAGTDYKIEEISREGYTLKEVKKAEGNDINVMVANGVVTGKVVADDNPDSLNPTSFEFVNAKDEGNIDITKKDAGGVVPGVEFTLYESDGTTIAKDSNGNNLMAVTDSYGNISFTNIPLGTVDAPKTYYLKETKTVEGYALLKEPIEVKLPYKYNVGDMVNGITVTEAGVTNHLKYTIINDKVFLLPSSGGKGIDLYIMFGVMLIVIALGGLYITARQKRKQ